MRSRQPVKLPDHHCIAEPPAVEGCLLLGPFVLDARGLLDKHLGTSSNVQGVELEREALVLGRDPSIAHIHRNACESSSKDSLFRREVSRGVTCPQDIVVRQSQIAEPVHQFHSVPSVDAMEPPQSETSPILTSLWRFPASALGTALSANVPLPLRGEETSRHHWRGISSCPNACIRHDDASLIYWLQEMIDGALADLAAVLNAFLDGLAKMVPDEDARQSVFVRGLREAGVRSPHLMRLLAPLLG
jgi:hypothetical protein